MKALYLITGPSHIPYLVTSVYSLRNRANFHDPVHVCVWPESMPIMSRVAKDDRLGIRIIERNVRDSARKKNATFIEKIAILLDHAESGCVFFDADTLPIGRIDWLAFLIESYGMVVTQFSDWTCDKGIITKRLQRAMVNEQMKPYLQQCIAERRRSVNNGVIGAHSDCESLATWYKWAKSVQNIFIPDETTLHAVTVTEEFKASSTVVAGRLGYNESPKHGCTPRQMVSCYHFHGDTHVRPDKCQFGHELWWPYFQQCLKANIGGMVDWLPGLGNRRLDALLEAPV